MKGLRPELIIPRVDVPVEALNLTATETDQRFAVAQGMIDEGELVVLRERHEPQGETTEIVGHGIAIDTIETTLSDETLGVEQFILVCSEIPWGTMSAPGFNQTNRQLPASLDQKGRRAGCWIEDLEVKDLLRSRVSAQAVQNRTQGFCHNRFGERSGGIDTLSVCSARSGVATFHGWHPFLSSGTAFRQ